MLGVARLCTSYPGLWGNVRVRCCRVRTWEQDCSGMGESVLTFRRPHQRSQGACRARATSDRVRTLGVCTLWRLVLLSFPRSPFEWVCRGSQRGCDRHFPGDSGNGALARFIGHLRATGLSFMETGAVLTFFRFPVFLPQRSPSELCPVGGVGSYVFASAGGGVLRVRPPPAWIPSPGRRSGGLRWPGGWGAVTGSRFCCLHSARARGRGRQEAS